MEAESPSDAKFQIGHVLFIDIVGYSKLLIHEQTEQLQKLREIVRGTEQFRAAQADGKLLRLPTGDGGALVFRNSPEEPVQCALQISKALKDHPDLQVRMGIHSGPVQEVTDINEQANIAGAGINIAQRVMDCGDAGHILVSKHVAEDLEHYARWRPYLHELGECEVKHGGLLSVFNLYTDDVGNPQPPEKFKTREKGERRTEVVPAASHSGRRKLIAAAIVLFLAVTVGLFLLAHRSRPGKSKIASNAPGVATNDKSIAVLPFVDLSQAHDQEYFCDGISEEILDALAKVEGLRVVARTSSFSFKGKNADVSEIAQKLNVQNVLEGSLRREANRIRVTAQLVDARNGFHVWSDTFERELQGVFAVQDEITRAITGALKVKLAGAHPAQKQNTEAHDLYLQGVFFSDKSTEEGLRKALEFFQRSLEKDPNSARAWAGIAKTWNWLADAYVRPLEAFPQMKAAAEKAIALDPDDAEAHIWMGESKRILDWDMKGFKAELNRALQLDPNSATAHCFMGLYEATHGDRDAAVMHVRESIRLDPLSPIISNFAALAYLCLGHLGEAIAEGKRTLELDPNYIYETPILADAYREKGMFPEAIALYLKAQQITGAPQPGLAVTYARMGRTAEARQILAELKEVAAKKYIAAEEIAAVYVALGEKDEAFKWLEQACDDHGGAVQAVPIRPVFRPLHSDPRFWAIVRRFGFDPSKVLNQQKNP